MDAGLKKDWLKALRSGKYKQGKHYLRDQDNAFCCLGVLCELIDPNRWIKEEGTNYWYYGDGDLDLPPLEDRLFWDDRGGSQNSFLVTTPEGRYAHIEELNDAGYTFDKLADIIEEQVVGV